MCETFKPVIKWLLFYAIFEVDPFEVWFCWSLGHQLKPVNVDVALPHYTVLLICNTHADILCDTNSMSLNYVRFIVIQARHFLHMQYIYFVYMLRMSMCLTPWK